MNKYKLINTYMALAREGNVNPLVCPDCKNEYTIWIPDDDQELENPVLRCWTCNADVTLGTYTLHLIEVQVNDKIGTLSFPQKN
jgi:hypothetical protein